MFLTLSRGRDLGKREKHKLFCGNLLIGEASLAPAKPGFGDCIAYSEVSRNKSA